MINLLDDLFSKANVRHYPKGQIIIYEGDPVEHLYRVGEGFIKVYNILESGTERIIFIYGPGDLFPLTSYLTGFGVGRYFYECMTDVKLQTMPLEGFDKMVKGNQELGEALIAYSYKINQEFIQRIDILSVNDARRKIISLLAFLLTKAGDDKSGQLNIVLTSHDFADMCGLTRETASVQLARLRKDGLISGSRKIAVDLECLKRFRKKYSIPSFEVKLTA